MNKEKVYEINIMCWGITLIFLVVGIISALIGHEYTNIFFYVMIGGIIGFIVTKYIMGEDYDKYLEKNSK